MAGTSLAKERIRFLLLEGVHPSAAECLAGAGYTEVELRPAALDEGALRGVLADVHFLGIRSRTRLTAELLEAAPRLVAVGCFCIGTDQVDLAAATERGIAVFNAPFSNTRSVAELVVAEAILLLRRVPEKSAAAHRGEWAKTARGANEIRGKRLGIVGYGNIGSQVSILAESLGMEVVFHDVITKLPMGNARAVGSLEALLEQCDVVTLHVPDTVATRSMIGATELARMPEGSVLINASRGTVVDLEALAASLESGHLRGAAVDVFPAEPSASDQPFESPLRGLGNVILTPHIGGSTVEAQENIGREVAEKLIRYSDNGTTLTSVNFPEVALPDHPGRHRILHVHRNVPGVLSALNRVFSEAGANIGAQYLETNATIGYVVTDLDAEQSGAVLEALRRVEGTIRCRVLY